MGLELVCRLWEYQGGSCQRAGRLHTEMAETIG